MTWLRMFKHINLEEIEDLTFYDEDKNLRRGVASFLDNVKCEELKIHQSELERKARYLLSLAISLKRYYKDKWEDFLKYLGNGGERDIEKHYKALLLEKIEKKLNKIKDELGLSVFFPLIETASGESYAIGLEKENGKWVISLKQGGEVIYKDTPARFFLELKRRFKNAG